MLEWVMFNTWNSHNKAVNLALFTFWCSYRSIVIPSVINIPYSTYYEVILTDELHYIPLLNDGINFPRSTDLCVLTLFIPDVHPEIIPMLPEQLGEKTDMEKKLHGVCQI